MLYVILTSQLLYKQKYKTHVLSIYIDCISVFEIVNMYSYNRIFGREKNYFQLELSSAFSIVWVSMNLI